MGKIRQIRPVQRKTPPSLVQKTPSCPDSIFREDPGPRSPRPCEFRHSWTRLSPQEPWFFEAFPRTGRQPPWFFSLLFAQVGVPNKIPKTKTGDFPLMCTHTAKKQLHLAASHPAHPTSLRAPRILLRTCSEGKAGTIKLGIMHQTKVGAPFCMSCSRIVPSLGP